MADFDDFVRARGGALLRFAYLLCGDGHRAEDLVQEALVRCHAKWRRIERLDGPEAYVRKAVLRQFLSWRRRRAAAELVADRFDDRPDSTDIAELLADRDAVRRMLAALSRRQRAVLVLRFYEDLPDAEIAELLGCSVATVRVHANRALRGLRASPDLAELTGGGTELP